VERGIQRRAVNLDEIHIDGSHYRENSKASREKNITSKVLGLWEMWETDI
jgi:hypothetical protein